MTHNNFWKRSPLVRISFFFQGNIKRLFVRSLAAIFFFCFVHFTWSKHGGGDWCVGRPESCHVLSRVAFEDSDVTIDRADGEHLAVFVEGRGRAFRLHLEMVEK